jgi:DHA2 family multidrug resistance protein-like MFS transporter
MSDMDGLPPGRRRLAIMAQAMVISMAVLDGSITNIALPSIAQDLHIQPADSIWVVNAYQLAITISLLPLASLGDIYGYRRVCGWGISIFTLASLACALSTSLPMLALSRVIQGFGAAGLMSVNTALVRFIFPRAQLGRGMGINGLVVSVSAAAGPSLAAAILTVAPWPYLFFINVPIGIVAIAMLRTLPATPLATHRFDWRSAALNAAMFGLFIAGVDGLGHGQSAPLVVVELAAAVAVGIVFVRSQMGMRAPILPVELFAIPAFSLSVLTSVCSFVAASMAFVSMPFLFAAGGLSTVDTGLLITPWPVTSAIMAPIAGRLSDRVSAGKLGGLGLLIFGLGLFAVANIPADPAWWNVAWRMAMCGGGFALFQAPNNRLLIASTPRERSGAGSGVLSSARLLGQTLGAALVAVTFGFTQAAGVGVGAHLAIMIGAAAALLAMVVSLLRLRV